MNIERLYEIYLKHPSISTDSRSIKNGDLFFALSGEKFNGNTFAQEAINKGASYAVIDDASYNKSKQYIVVENVLDSLQQLARYHRQQFSIPFIGITGTNGKTTTKELVNKVLEKKFNTVATEGNLNNHIGVPLTLLKVNEETEVAVIEMGANHPKEIAFLCTLAQPTVGIITNVGLAHLEGFKNFQGIVTTKKELYDAIKVNQGKIIINADDEQLVEMLGNYPAFAFSKEDNHDLMIRNVSSSPYLCFEWKSAQSSYFASVKTHLLGEYHLSNVASAISIGVYFNIPFGDINNSIENYVPSNNRSQIILTKLDNTIWLDAYNANPTSMAAAIQQFLQHHPSQPVLILGEMLELGTSSEPEHQKIIHSIQQYPHAKVFLVGKAFKPFSDIYNHFNTTELLGDYLSKHEIAHQNILIKGSRYNRLEDVIKFL